MSVKFVKYEEAEKLTGRDVYRSGYCYGCYFFEGKEPTEELCHERECEGGIFLEIPDEQDTTQDQSALSSQVGGDHYKKLGIYQPWLVLQKWLTEEELRGFAKGTAIVYLAREKNGIEDMDKALHTLKLFFEVKNNGKP